MQSDPTGLWGGLNTYSYAYNDPLGYIDPTGEVPIAPIVVGYLRCVASCTGQAAAMEGLFGDLKCFDPGQTAKDCALSCANPLNWFRKSPNVNNARDQISKWYSTRKRAKDAARRKGAGGGNQPHGPDAYGKEGHFHDKNHDDKSKPDIHYRWGARR